MPLMRGAPFDIDEDIIILPDFKGRSINKLLIMPCYILDSLQKALNADCTKQTFELLIDDNCTSIIEQG